MLGDIAVKSAAGVSVAEKLEFLAASIRYEHQKFQMSVISIGRYLIEAREMCTHGEWLPWLQELGMSHTQADNYMRYAREIKPGTWISELPYAKGLALLGLPEEDRAPFVEKNDIDGKSAAEVKKLVAAEKKARQEAETARIRLEEAEKKITALENRPIETVQIEVEPADYKPLKESVQKLQRRAESAELAACEAEDRASKAVADAQQLRMRLADQDDASHLGNSSGLSLDDLIDACNDFSGRVWSVPFMHQQFRESTIEMRRGYRLIVDGVRSWAQQVLDAIDEAEKPLEVEGDSYDVK